LIRIRKATNKLLVTEESDIVVGVSNLKNIRGKEFFSVQGRHG